MAQTALNPANADAALAFIFVALFLISSGIIIWHTLNLVGPPLLNLLAIIIFNIVALIGTAIEMPGRRKMVRGEKPFKLPFIYRMCGWEIGCPGPGEHQDYQTTMFFDAVNNRILPLVRRSRME